MLEAFCARVLRLGAEHPAAARRPARTRATPAALEQFLSERRGSRVEVRTPGARREAAAPGARRPERARSRSSRTLIQSEQKRLRRVEALEELREALNLESLPLRIECYDISNIQAESPVGSMVVFQDAVAEEGALPEVRRAPPGAGPDDFAAIAEVVSRRFARLGDADAPRTTTSRSRRCRTWS